MAVRARERLINTAEDLFYAEGIHAVGIERILQESGVGRASLYRHFASKDELVVAVLRQRDTAWRQWLREAVTEQNVAAADRPLAVFDVLAKRFAQSDYRGCAFINTMIEAADRNSAAHLVAAEHKAAVIDYLTMLLRDAGYGDDHSLAEQLMLLIDGATVTTVREGGGDAAHRAKAIAQALLINQTTHLPVLPPARA